MDKRPGLFKDIPEMLRWMGLWFAIALVVFGLLFLLVRWLF